MLEIKIEKRAQRFIRKRPGKHARQIVAKIDLLAENPFPPDSKFLAEYGAYRADVGEYRIIYNVRGDALNVPLIGKRNDDEVYKRLRRLRKS